MKYNRQRFGIREVALAIAVIFMVYLTATAFSLRNKILSKASEVEESRGPQITFPDSTQEFDAKKRRLVGHEMQQ